MKKVLLTAACFAIVGTTSMAAAATFAMYSPVGGVVGIDTTVTGSRNASTWNVASTTAFFGLTWTAHNGTTFGPGNYTIDTVEGGIYNITVPAGMTGGHILFDWGTTADIDVINVWDAAGISQDVDGDGIRGIGMIDGAFPGFNANFDNVPSVPEPASMLLIGSGLAGLLGLRRRK